MPEKIRELSPPTGCGRLLFRFPVTLYKIGLGWVFGQRMLLLNHIGRKSGLARQAVLEVVGHNKESDTYYIVAGFGPETQWYLNLRANPNVNIQVGRRKLEVFAKSAAPEEARQVLLDFVKNNPSEARLVRLLGYEVDGTDEDWRSLGEELIMLALRPR